MSKELRFMNGLRVEKRTGAGDEMAIVGYASKFNVLSHDLGGFRERVQTGTFSRSLRTNADVKALFNHIPDNILGRTKAGTLTLSEDSLGLKWRCTLNPKSQAHRDLYQAIDRGDVDECSFAFMVTPEGQKWEESKDPDTGKDCLLRTLTDVDLLDVSAVTYPAYPNTSVDARSMAARCFPDGQPMEIRSAVNAFAEKRGNTGRTDINLQRMILTLRKATKMYSRELVRARMAAASLRETPYPAPYDYRSVQEHLRLAAEFCEAGFAMSDSANQILDSWDEADDEANSRGKKDLYPYDSDPDDHAFRARHKASHESCRTACDAMAATQLAISRCVAKMKK